MMTVPETKPMLILRSVAFPEYVVQRKKLSVTFWMCDLRSKTSKTKTSKAKTMKTKTSKTKTPKYFLRKALFPTVS